MRKLTTVFCLMTGVLWAVSAAPLEVNGKFRVLGAGRLYEDADPVSYKCAPAGWQVLPERSGRFVTIQTGKGFRVRFLSSTSNTFGLAYHKMFPVKPGEKYRLSVDANGKNTVANVAALYFSNETDPIKSSRVSLEIDAGDGNVQKHDIVVVEKKYIGSDYNDPVKLNGAKTIVRTITIPANVNGGVPALMQVCFYVKWPLTMTDFSNFKLEKLTGSISQLNNNNQRKSFASRSGKKKW